MVGNSSGGGPGGLGQNLFRVLTGSGEADVSGRGANLRGMLRAIGGSSARTRSGIDLTQAANRLGVSRRTVERWVRSEDTGQGQRPSAQRLQALQRVSRQVASTRAGRRGAIQAARAARRFSRGARVSITGEQGPKYPGKDYKRTRTTQLDLDPGAAEAMLNAWERGGERGFLSWATQHWGSEYVDDWDFGRVDGVEVQNPFGGDWR